jgi:hypothetical protein
MNPGVFAIDALARMGYRPLLEGEDIYLKWQGQGHPNPEQVRPLLAMLKTHKAEAIAYLAEKSKVTERVLSCFECGHFRPAVSPNPTQAFGHCEKRGKGRYGCATACPAVLEVKP